MPSRSVKATALTVAAGVITWGVQAFPNDPATGVIGIAIGLAVMLVYQVAEEYDHGQVYNDVVDAIGQENFEALAELSADELRGLIKKADTDTGQD